jgi:adenine-specific DNA glycosylase
MDRDQMTLFPEALDDCVSHENPGRYDARRDRYHCPAAQRLDFNFQIRELGRDVRYCATPACSGCRLRPKCTRNARGRCIARSADEGFLEAMERRVRRRPEKLKRRKGLLEHPFPLRGPSAERSRGA